MKEFEPSQTGKIVRWQRNGRRLFAQAQGGKPGGAELYLSHGDLEQLRMNWAPFLKPNHESRYDFMVDVMPENCPKSAWRYSLRERIRSFEDILIYQIEVIRMDHCTYPDPLLVTFGLMLRFATEGTFAQVMQGARTVVTTDEPYNCELVPMSASDGQDRTVVETVNGRFDLLGIGTDGIVADTSRSDRYFGVMLTSGAFEPIKLLPGEHFIQTVNVRYVPGQ